LARGRELQVRKVVKRWRIFMAWHNKERVSSNQV